jgi:hypothetical protein
MGDLLKEAIADAKAVRETALANAKAALEEAFTPKLQSMLSQKLKEEEVGDEDEEETEEGYAEEGEDHEEDAESAEEMESDELESEEEEIPVADDEEGEKDIDVAVEDDEVDGGEEDDEDLDLEAIIKELEEEDEEEEEVEESTEESTEDSVEEATEEEAEITEDEDEGEDEDVVDEEIVDLSELLNDLTEDEDDSEEVKAENIRLSGSLKEHRKVVKYLKDKLNEVNLLNAKLLYTNKLFKGYNLNNDQKLKIVETFDRAKNSREVKLVYSTLAEAFAGKTGSAVTKINESKSIASKSTGSTKPKQVISEGNELANRFKKLAGII